MKAAPEETIETYPTEMALDSWLSKRHPNLRKLAPKMPPPEDEASNTPLSYIGNAHMHARILRILRELLEGDADEMALENTANQIIEEMRRSY